MSRLMTCALLLIMQLSLVIELVAGAGKGSSFQGILHQVTEEKLEKLRIQKDLMTDHFNPVLETVSQTSKNSHDVLQILYSALKTSPIKDIIDTNLVENLKHVLEDSKVDPSLTPQLISAWIKKVQREIEYALRKCQYSYYFAAMLGDWLEVEERKLDKSANTSSENARIAKEAAIQKISEIIFKPPSPKDFKGDLFKKYLDEEFFIAGESKDVDNLVKKIRKEASEFLNVENHVVSTSDLNSCIEGLVSENLLSETKKTALRELAQNSETLTEVASLLTNRVRNIDRWEWPNTTIGQPVDVRRGLGGEYTIYLNEDLITSLFLQYVGVHWTAFFKQRLLRIYNSKMWKRLHHDHDSIEAERDRFHENAFLSTLPDSFASQKNKNKDEYVKIESVQIMRKNDGGGGSGSFTRPTKSKQRVTFKEEEYDYLEADETETASIKKTRIRPRPPPRPKQIPEVDFMQSFLHVLNAEIRLHQVIYPKNPTIVVQAQFKAFGPSANHEAALITMEKFGVSKQWLDFFKRFLQPTIKFAEDSEPKKMLRGIPASHALSNLFGETLLFVLESVGNRKCDGMRIYRLTDEFWFWNKEPKHVTQGWQTLNEFGRMVGLKVNVKRSGSVKVQSGPSKRNGSIPGPEPLPQRNIHWGYLELHSDGTFKIDQKAVTKFLDEMKGLLGKAECTIEWIQIFNKYMVFFVRNFGKGALVFGKQHLDQITSALRTIYAGVFGSLEKSPVQALKERYEKHKETDFLDAWIYWPLDMGGLGLTDPFIDILSLRKAYEKINDEDLFRKIPLQDKIEYDELKVSYNREHGIDDNIRHRRRYKIDETISDDDSDFLGDVDPEDPDTAGTHSASVEYDYEEKRRKRSAPRHEILTEFKLPKLQTWEEYLATRETQLEHWYRRYLRLLERPDPESPVMPNKFWQLGSKIPNEEPARNYFMWLYNYFEPQLELYFGTSTFIDSGLLPKSIIAKIQNANLNY